ncbi:GntR family transcriptional regulator [Brevibacterium casei]|nr:GntR family transcriptional regulator [Brevibacterium casei]
MAASRVGSTLSAEAYDRLRAELLRGCFTPGSKLRIGEIADRFSVSPSVLREAMTRLAQDGLLSASPQRGFSVPELTAGLLEDLTRARRIIEAAALRSRSPTAIWRGSPWCWRPITRLRRRASPTRAGTSPGSGIALTGRFMPPSSPVDGVRPWRRSRRICVPAPNSSSIGPASSSPMRPATCPRSIGGSPSSRSPVMSPALWRRSNAISSGPPTCSSRVRALRSARDRSTGGVIDPPGECPDYARERSAGECEEPRGIRGVLVLWWLRPASIR